MDWHGTTTEHCKKTHLGDGPFVLQGHIHNLQETESRLGGGDKHWYIVLQWHRVHKAI